MTPARCWQEWRTAQSTHKPTFALSAAPNVHGGAAALSATYPGTDFLGFSAIVALPDMGTCAIPATPGHVYRFSGWYKSSGPVVRDAPGAPEHERRLDAGGDHHPARGRGRLDALHRRPAGRARRRHRHRARRPVQGGDDASCSTTSSSSTRCSPWTSRCRARAASPARRQASSCPTDCTESYPLGTSVTLTATPTGNARFTGWSGACTGTGPCTVAMTEARAVVAAFLDPANPQGVKHKLTIAFAGAGQGHASRARRRRSAARRRATSRSWRTRRSA